MTILFNINIDYILRSNSYNHYLNEPFFDSLFGFVSSYDIFEFPLITIWGVFTQIDGNLV